MARPSKRKIRIIAFGFDKVSNVSDNLEFEGEEYTIHHVPYDSDESLASADALMLPSDIFEKAITRTHPVYGNTYTIYDCETKKLAEREKEMFRVLDKNGWACLLGV